MVIFSLSNYINNIYKCTAIYIKTMKSPPLFVNPILIFVLIAFICLSELNAQGYVSDGVSKWIVDKESGCKSYNAKPKVGETILWKGFCKDGYIHGSGRLEWRINGGVTEISEGNFVMGRQHGSGSREWPTKGSRFIGQIDNGRFHGDGKYYFNDGRFYDGQFKFGKFEGRGVLYAGDGKVIKSGLWREGQFLESISDIKKPANSLSNNQLEFNRIAEKCKQLGIDPNTKDYELCLKSLRKIDKP